MNVPMGMIATLTLVVESVRFVPLPADGAGLGGVRLTNDLKGNALVLELVPQIVLDLPEVPVREFLCHLAFADFLFILCTILFLPSRSIPLYSFGVATIDFPNFVFYAPVHEIFGDFVSFVCYLMLGLGKDIPLLALELLPATGTLDTLRLCLGYAPQLLVAKPMD